MRAHLLLAVLGSVSLFSLESFGMDPDEELAAADVSSQKVTNPQLDEKIKQFISNFELDEKEPLTKEQRRGLRFFTAVVHQRELINLDNWLEAMAILVLKGNEDQKIKGFTALLGTLRTTTDKSFPKFEVASFILEKASLTISQKENLYSV